MNYHGGFGKWELRERGSLYTLPKNLRILGFDFQTMEMHPRFTHEELIVDWFKRSQGQRTRKFTIFDQFISLWFSFNSWVHTCQRKLKMQTCSDGSKVIQGFLRHFKN